MKTIHFKSIDSTNAYLKSNHQHLDHMTWVSTDHQTHGKGRTSKIWFGNESSLMCSVLLKDDLNINDIKICPLLAAMSLHQVLSNYHHNIKIKWPNDLLIDDLKVSGILVESIIESNHPQAIIIGFGVNINHSFFDDDIKDIATSLFQTTQKTYDKNEIYKDLMHQFEKDYEMFKSDHQSIIDYCNQHLAFMDQEITFKYNQKHTKAKVIKINDDGHLLVKTKTRIMSLHSGEISILK